MSDTTGEHIAFLGAGAMGAPMTRRLLSRGHRVTVWSRTPSRLAALAAEGATLTDDIGVAVGGASVVMGCLRDTDVTRDCYLGDATRAALRPGVLAIEHGTFDPSLAERIAQEYAAQGCTFVDAPVTGGPEGAEAGTLMTMVGASPEAFARARPLLEAFSRDVVHTGGPGSGARLKLINQLLVSIHIVAAAEAGALALRAGLDPAAVERVLTGGWGASTMLARSLPRALAGQFGPSGASIGKIDEVQPLIAGMLRDAGLEARLFPHARATLDAAVAAGDGDLDVAALVRRY